MAVDRDYQLEYWETERKRRAPGHPVVQEYSRPILEFFWSHLNLELGSGPPLTLLDLGSGNGYFSYELRNDFTITAVDFSHQMLMMSPLENRVQADISQLPFQDESFDIVLCANTLHHVEDVNACLKEMRRIARKRVVNVEPNGSCPVIQLQSRIMPAEREARKFSPAFLRQHVEESGLKVLAETSTGVILPKRFKEWMLPVLRIFNRPLPWALYNVVISSKG